MVTRMTIAELERYLGRAASNITTATSGTYTAYTTTNFNYVGNFKDTPYYTWAPWTPQAPYTYTYNAPIACYAECEEPKPEPEPEPCTEEELEAFICGEEQEA